MWQDETGEAREKPAPISIRLPRIPHGVIERRTRDPNDGKRVYQPLDHEAGLERRTLQKNIWTNRIKDAERVHLTKKFFSRHKKRTGCFRISITDF